MEDINKNLTILNDYELELKKSNGGCEADVVLYSYIKYIRSSDLNMDHLIGILGTVFIMEITFIIF